MNLFRLCMSYLRRNLVTTTLNVLLLALGVATIALLLIVARELHERLLRDAQGIDLVVGAKGSPLQLVLAGVFHADTPTGNIPLDEVVRLRADARVAQVIPLSLGDNLLGFRIVGTEVDLIAHYGASLESGNVWGAPFEAVVGAEVAAKTGLKVGQTFAGVHGLGAGGGEHAATPYRVVGILRPAGRVIDRLVLTDLASVWEAHEHQENPSTNAAHDNAKHDEAREVTMALVKYKTPLATVSLPREINARTQLQAASPAFEAARLFNVFGLAMDVLRGFAIVLIAAAVLSMFASLYRAIDQRKYDVAIMRMLGASRGQVVGALLLESLILAVCGVLLGLLLGHFVASRMAMVTPGADPLAGAAWRLLPEEGWIVLLALASGILAALIPAWRAYRLDVAAVLAKG
jgi:putative ABC transport system permease protein